MSASPGGPPDAEAARAALDGAGDVAPWAERFALLADPGRLRLLFCVHRVPGIRVGDLAAAVGMSESATSHALRLLRTRGWVSTERDGRAVRCTLADDVVHDLLHHIGPPHP